MTFKVGLVMGRPVITLKKLVVRFALIIVVSLVVPYQAWTASTNLDVARDFVTRHGVGRNLPDIAMAAATRTQTFATLTSTLGAGHARRVVQREIDALVPNFQTRWNENLAASYAKHFSTEELASLASEGKHSKYTPTLGARRAEVGASMRATSEVVVTELVTEALKNAISTSAKGVGN